MKRITVSLPDDLVDQVRTAAGEGQVSAYIATALTEYQQRVSLDALVAAWEAETPVPDEVRRQVEAELDGIGLMASPRRKRAG